MAKKKVELRVHPAAAVFPMLDDEALAELAEDIKANGLREPIVMMTDGQLLDGRNRLAACELAGIEPATVLYEGGDPTGFVLSLNVHRRHMTKGQLAMAVAQVCLETKQPMRDAAGAARVSASRIAQASTVLSYAPELSGAVMSGAMSLDAAYKTAQDRKAEQSSREQVAERERRRLMALRERASDLADQVVEERLTISEAEAAWQARKIAHDDIVRLARGAADTIVSHLRTDVASIISAAKIGEPVPLDTASLTELYDLLDTLKEHQQ